MDEKQKQEALAFYEGVKFALSLLLDNQGGATAVLSKCPESYTNGHHDAEMALARWLWPDNAKADQMEPPATLGQADGCKEDSE